MTFKFYTSLWLIKSSIFNAKPQVIKVVAHFKKYSYKKLLGMSKKRLEGVMLRCLKCKLFAILSPRHDKT